MVRVKQTPVYQKPSAEAVRSPSYVVVMIITRENFSVFPRAIIKTAFASVFEDDAALFWILNEKVFDGDDLQPWMRGFLLGHGHPSFAKDEEEEQEFVDGCKKHDEVWVVDGPELEDGDQVVHCLTVQACV